MQFGSSKYYHFAGTGDPLPQIMGKPSATRHEIRWNRGSRFARADRSRSNERHFWPKGRDKLSFVATFPERWCFSVRLTSSTNRISSIVVSQPIASRRCHGFVFMISACMHVHEVDSGCVHFLGSGRLQSIIRGSGEQVGVKVALVPANYTRWRAWGGGTAG